MKKNQLRLVPIICLATNLFCTPSIDKTSDAYKKSESDRNTNELKLEEKNSDTLVAKVTTDLEKLTQSRWYLSRVIHGENKRKLGSLERKNNWVEFQDNGIMEIMEFGENYKGTWEYNKINKQLTTDDVDGRIVRNIDLLQDSILVTSNLLDNRMLVIEFDKSPI